MKLLLNSFYARIIQKRLCHNVKHIKDKYFITTPIYYLNSVPHIGHFYTNLLADVSKRWKGLQGFNTHLSTGTDEHGLKVLQAATQQGQNVEAYCDDLSSAFKSLFDLGSINYTSFIRTTDPHHVKTVQSVWQELDRRGYIRKGLYKGWYSVSEEAYVPTEQVEEVTGEDGCKYMACISTGNRLEWSEEENFMFPLSSFSKPLRQWLDSGVIHPPHHLELIRQWVDAGLPDLSLSRQSDKNPWGVPVPGNPQQTVYVWLDALVNYLTASNYKTSSSSSPLSVSSSSQPSPPPSSPPPSSPPPPPLSSSPPPPSGWWPPDCQVVGKDIIKFHAVYWPAFLMALGLPLPRKVLCHGHWMVQRGKMSKSRGNVVDPVDRIQRWSADSLRYYLMKESSVSSDSDYSDQRAVECINADLVNTYGNLLSRSTGLTLNPSQTFPPLHLHTYQHLCGGYKNGFDLLERLYGLRDSIAPHYDSFHYNKVLEKVMTQLYDANAFFQHCQPWKMQREEIDCVLHVSLEAVRVCSLGMLAIIPTLANKALDRLNIPVHHRLYNHMTTPIGQQARTDYKLGADTGVLLKRIKVVK